MEIGHLFGVRAICDSKTVCLVANLRQVHARLSQTNGVVALAVVVAVGIFHEYSLVGAVDKKSS